MFTDLDSLYLFQLPRVCHRECQNIAHAGCRTRDPDVLVALHSLPRYHYLTHHGHLCLQRAPTWHDVPADRRIIAAIVGFAHLHNVKTLSGLGWRSNTFQASSSLVLAACLHGLTWQLSNSCYCGFANIHNVKTLARLGWRNTTVQVSWSLVLQYCLDLILIRGDYQS